VVLSVEDALTKFVEKDVQVMVNALLDVHFKIMPVRINLVIEGFELLVKHIDVIVQVFKLHFRFMSSHDETSFSN